MKASTAAVGVVIAILLSGLAGGFTGYYLKSSGTVTAARTVTTTITTAAQSTGTFSTGPTQGVITGIVNVAGQAPSNISDYKLIFNPICPTGSSCDRATLVPIYPSGHFSALLDAGNYTILGMSPSCDWSGCSAAFPQSMTVEGGQQLVADIDIEPSTTGGNSVGTTIVSLGETYTIQSSYDCLAGHTNQTFVVTAPSHLNGGLEGNAAGVMLYVATAQQALTISRGHPATWIYSSGVTNSTYFEVNLSPGEYVLWIEGADMGCGASVVEPLEYLTTVTVVQAVMLFPS